jgi:hypothetical protein
VRQLIDYLLVQSCGNAIAACEAEFGKVFSTAPVQCFQAAHARGMGDALVRSCISQAWLSKVDGRTLVATFELSCSLPCVSKELTASLLAACAQRIMELPVVDVLTKPSLVRLLSADDLNCTELECFNIAHSFILGHAEARDDLLQCVRFPCMSPFDFPAVSVKSTFGLDINDPLPGLGDGAAGRRALREIVAFCSCTKGNRTCFYLWLQWHASHAEMGSSFRFE